MHFITRRPSRLAPLILFLAAAGCDRAAGPETEEAETATEELAEQAEDLAETPGIAPEGDIIRFAEAEMHGASGSEVSGMVWFERQGEFLKISGELSGLEPGPHAIHIHEVGDCTAPDASTAGGHYSPDDDPHGAPTEPASLHHAGDLGNIVASEDGTALIDFADRELALNRDADILQRAVIVHAEADDLESQPSGAAGKRVACGVIRAVPRPDYTP